jgi:glutathione S-transferase
MSPLAVFPGFAAYSLTAVALVLNLALLWYASGGARALSKTTPNEEDAKTFGKGISVTTEDPPAVARAMRSYRNALSAIVPFLFLALVYVLVGAPARTAWITFGVFTGARVLHSVAYALRLQPWRTTLYVVSQLTTGFVMIQIVRAVVPSL